MSKLLLKEYTSTNICQTIKSRIAIDNVFTFYSLAKIYKLETVYELCLTYIERCFPMVVETQSFLHSDFSIVAKILDSSDLNIHSEVEVFEAAYIWLNHNSKKRSKYAEQLLLKVRLPLLSEQALEYVLEKVIIIFSLGYF